MRSIFILALAVTATPALAATDITALERKVVDFTGAAIGAEGGPAQPLDRRLHLADCAGQPDLTWRSDRKDAVVVHCAAAGWRIFVPVRTAAPLPVVRTVAARSEPVIRRGDLITLSAESSGFSVSGEGVAMTDAVPGARFAVRITGAKAPVQAIATEAGRATLPGW